MELYFKQKKSQLLFLGRYIVVGTYDLYQFKRTRCVIFGRRIYLFILFKANFKKKVDNKYCFNYFKTLFMNLWITKY